MSDGSLGEDVQNFIAGQSTMDDKRYQTTLVFVIRHVIEFEIIDNSLQQLYDALDLCPSWIRTFIGKKQVVVVVVVHQRRQPMDTTTTIGQQCNH